jgi:integrase
MQLRHELPAHLKPVLMFGYYTGARKSEILSLKWPQIDLDAGTAYLEPGSTKNGQARIIPLHGELLDSVKELKTSRGPGPPDCPYVFSRAGKAIGSFHVSWRSACKRAGLDGRLFHDLRRTAVRNMVRAGVPERVAMAISGHKTRSVFDRYNIVVENDLHTAARQLESYLRGFN